MPEFEKSFILFFSNENSIINYPVEQNALSISFDLKYDIKNEGWILDPKKQEGKISNENSTPTPQSGFILLRDSERSIKEGLELYLIGDDGNMVLDSIVIKYGMIETEVYWIEFDKPTKLNTSLLMDNYYNKII